MSFPDYPSGDVEGDLLRLVHRQVAFGPRYPGSEAHRLFRSALADALGRHADRLVLQDFQVPLRGAMRDCTNIAAVFTGTGGCGRESTSPGTDAAGLDTVSTGEWPNGLGAVLIGTHFDTRIIGDNEPNEVDRAVPIPGANDGGSGTAVLLYLASDLAALSRMGRLRRDVHLVLFDAEDVGHLDGNPFAAGAERYAASPPLPLPGEVIVLDMVGGRNMVFNVDSHIAHYPGSLALTRRVFSLGSSLGYHAFSLEKRKPFTYIISDHAPFMTRGIPSCILIDIDYPQWHTRSDLPDAMDGASLVAVRHVLLEYLTAQDG